MPDRRYWDETAFAGAFSDAESGAAQALLGIERGGGVAIVTSAISLLGLFAMPLTDAQYSRIHDYMRRHYIKLVELDRSTAEFARDIASEHGVRITLAVHVASAIRARVPLLETYREDLHSLSGTVRATPKLIIRQPQLALPGDREDLFAPRAGDHPLLPPEIDIFE